MQSDVRNGIVRLIPNQDLISWDFDWAECTPNGAGGGSVETLALSSAGAIYVGGSFTTFEASSRPRVARLVESDLRAVIDKDYRSGRATRTILSSAR